ncbi:hypothetical protein Btru_040542 [Bulinus truncatus]|nr:hypothetical protein Btru_040542 [Bulinus truncatus]
MFLVRSCVVGGCVVGGCVVGGCVVGGCVVGGCGVGGCGVGGCGVGGCVVDGCVVGGCVTGVCVVGGCGVGGCGVGGCVVAGCVVGGCGIGGCVVGGCVVGGCVVGGCVVGRCSAGGYVVGGCVVGGCVAACDNPACDNPACDNPTCDNPACDSPACDNPASDNPACDNPACDNPACDNPACDNPACDNPACDNSAWDNLACDNSAWDNLACDNSAWDNPVAPSTDQWGATSIESDTHLSGITRVVLDELSLLSPDLDEDSCDTDFPFGHHQKLTIRTEPSVSSDNTPAARLPRVAFADVDEGKDDHCPPSVSKKPGKCQTAGIIKSGGAARSSEGVASHFRRSSAHNRHNDIFQPDIPSCLKRSPAHCPAVPVIPAPYHAQLSSVTETGESCQMSFPQISFTCDDAHIGQGIELNTLKFQTPGGEPAGWYISRPAGSSTPMPQNNVSMSSADTNRVSQTGCHDEFIPNHVTMDNHINKSGHFRTGSMTSSVSRLSQTFQDRNKNDVTDLNDSTDDGGGGGRTTQERPGYHQHQTGQPKHFPQPCCTMGLHPGFNRDRRLPDYFTIDQCYSGNDDTESSTIRIVANFNTSVGLQQQQQQQQDARHAEIYRGQGGQGHAARRGPSDAPPRKERISLRRGLMMRQMSMNPTHEQEMHLLSDDSRRPAENMEESGHGYFLFTINKSAFQKNKHASTFSLVYSDLRKMSLHIVSIQEPNTFFKRRDGTLSTPGFSIGHYPCLIPLPSHLY